jgi:dipeptidyl aminopeptidase/acylaminoacyl peptidase
LKIQVLFLFLTMGAAAAGRQPFGPEDLWNWRTASDPRVSPDGQWLIYTEAWNDKKADSEYSNLWLASTDGKTRRQWTEGAWRDHAPRWSPDSTRIAWIAERGGTIHVRVRMLSSSEEVQLAGGELAPLSLAWSPEGNAIAFTAKVPVKTAPPAWAPESILPWLRRAAESTAQVFVVPASGGPAKQISSGDLECAGEPSWTLDGHWVVMARGGVEIDAIRISDGVVKTLAKPGGRVESPILSPEGARIAYLARSAGLQSYSIRKLWVMNADGGRVRPLAGTLDRDAGNPQWSSDSRTVYFTADDRGSTHVYAARNDGTVRQVTSGIERLVGFSLADNGRAASVRWSPKEAGDVVTFTVDQVTQPVTLASPNGHLLAEREIGAVEHFEYESAGHSIQARIIKPATFDAAARYPMLLDIQDSPDPPPPVPGPYTQDNPRSMCGVEFSLREQIFAARGFVVLCANPRGTPGYGEEFGSLLKTRYPGDDYEDLMRGVDAVLAKGYVDPKRVSVTGGLVAAWAIGHTDRFQRAVARRPIVDWVTDIAVSPDGSRRAAEWMGAMPWDDPDQYVKHSPIFFAGNFQTPTLVIAGKHDPESEELWFALRARKVESEMLTVPGNSAAAHIKQLEAELAWLGR